MPTSPTSPFGGSGSKALINIGGFGRIFDLSPGDLLLQTEGARRLIDAEADIVEHMNSHHADAIELYAMVLGAAAGLWRMTGSGRLRHRSR